MTAHRNADRAYVTLVTNADYAAGAEALMRSIALTGAEADRVVMHTGGVSKSDLETLQGMGVRLVEIDLLPMSDAFNARHSRKAQHDAAPFTKGEKPSFHTPLDNFAKLRLWQMTEYKAVIFIDADALMLKNCDRLFDYPEFCAAPNVYESVVDFHRLNSGVFTARPSTETYAKMLEALGEEDKFWRRTDQTFLEHYFPNWHGLPVFYNMLQYVWFNLPALWDWNSIHILHYQYEKPWQSEHPKAEKLKPLIDLWWQYKNGETPDLTALTNPK